MANELQHELSIISVPEVFRERYKYVYDVRHSTTMNVGEIAPIYVNPLVNPGDTFKIGATLFLSLTTSLFATQDQLAADIYFFQERNMNLAPWKKLWGENTKGAWAVETEIHTPNIIIHTVDEINARSILNKMGIPQMKGTGKRKNAILIPRYPYNLYIRVYNEWFRDQNYIEPIDEDTILGENDIDYKKLPQIDMCKASRHHDIYYVLPEPRKGNAPAIPVGSKAPVYGENETLLLNNGTASKNGIGYLTYHAGDYAALRVGTNPTNTIPGDTAASNANMFGENTNVGLARKTDVPSGYSYAYADLTNTAGAELDEQRYVLGLNHIFENMALYGSRYREMTRGSFGVISSSEINNIPEFLGAKHIPLNMTTVLQTSQSSGDDFMGGTAGFSNTLEFEDSIFTKSFDVHSTILGVCVIRQTHSYCQGLPLWALKQKKYDFYNPELEGLSNVAMPKSAIMVTGTNSDNEPWGYYGIYNEYRTEPNIVTGMLAPNSVNSASDTNIANYMYTDYYANQPSMGKDYLEEKPDFVDRTLTVNSSQVDQFRCDFVFHVTKITEVPRLELPGIDKF